MHLTPAAVDYTVRRFNELCVDLADTVNVLKEHFNVPDARVVENIFDRRTHKYRAFVGTYARVEGDTNYYRVVDGPWCQDNVHAFLVEASSQTVNGRRGLLLVNRANNRSGRPRKSTKETKA